jgi:hypothetical protein
VAFVYPDDGEIEPPVVRDRWTGGSILQKCQRPFGPVPSGDALSRSMLDMRLSVLIAALRGNTSSEKENSGSLLRRIWN